MISQGGHLSQAFPHEPGIPAPSPFFACESSPDLSSPHPPAPRAPVALGSQQIMLVINTGTHLWSADTGPKLQEEM